MKVIIDLTEQEYKKFKEYKGQIDLGRKAIRNGTPILKDATNGIAVLSLFPDISITVLPLPRKIKTTIGTFDLDWWYSSYNEISG